MFPPPLTPAPKAGHTAPPSEVVSARTADTALYDNHDGTFTRRISQGMNYLASPGNYQPVNLNFQAGSGSVPGASFVENHSNVTVTVSPGGIATADAHGSGLRFVTPALASVSATAATAVVAGVAWRFEPTGSGIELSGMVASPLGLRTYTFPLALLGGASALTVDANGDLVSNSFQLGRALVIGANGVPYPAGAWTLATPDIAQFSVSDVGLPAAAYPYLIDPPVTYQQAASLGDSFLDYGSYPQSGPATQYDGSQWLLADDSTTAGSDFAINFDTTSIPPSAYVEAVSLVMSVCLSTYKPSDDASVYVDYENGVPLTPSAMYPPQASGLPAAGPVSTLPAGSSNPQACVVGQADGPQAGWGLATHIQQGGTTTLRVRIGNQQGTWVDSPYPTGANYAYFAGYADRVNDRPYLGVTFVLPAPAPTQVSPLNQTVNTLTPTLSVNSETDTDGDSPVQYAFAVDTQNPGTGAGLVWLSGTPQPQGSWTPGLTSVTVGTQGFSQLTWNRTYYWRACAWDGSDPVSECSPWTAFTTPPQPPPVPTPITPQPGGYVTSTVQFTASMVPDPNHGSTSYEFQVLQNGSLISDSGKVASPSYTVSGLADANSYSWQVESWSSVGPTPSGYSGWLNNPFTVDSTPPPAPTVSPAMVPWSSSSSAPYSWTDSDNRVAGYAYNFVPASATDPGTTSMGSATSVTETVGGIGTWFFTIRGINAAGVPGATATATYVMGAASPPPTGGAIGPLEQLGGCTCGYSTQDTLGQNVDTATGDFWRSYTDDSISGRGPGLDLTRTYNSLLAGTQSAFGNGWTSDYLMSLNIGATTTVVNQETGSQASFTASGTAWVPAEPRVLATLVHSGTTWTFTRKGTQIFTFNSQGWLTSISDPNGNATTLSYNGSTITITDGSGRTLVATVSGTFGQGGLITSVTDGTRTVHYHYLNGNLIQVDDIGGGATSFGYDSHNNMTSIKQPDQQVPTSTATTGIQPTSPVGGQPWANSYDTQHRVTQTVDFDGYTTAFSYAPGVTTTSTTVTDPNGFVTLETYQYGELMSKITGYVPSGGSVWTYTYDPTTLGTTSVTDPRVHTSLASFDANGNKLTATDALGHTTHYAGYNSFDEPGAVGDPDGVTTTYSYDQHGNVTETSTPLNTAPGTNQVVRFSYTDANPGDLTHVSDPDGHGVTYTYDSYGDVKSTVDDLGDLTTYDYDTATGQRKSMVSPDGNAKGQPGAYTTTYAYDAFGDLISQTDPNGNEVVNDVYTSDRNLLTSTAPHAVNPTTYSYDGDNQLVKTVSPDGAFTQESYDGDHNIVGYSEASGHVVDYSFTDAAFPNKPKGVFPLNGQPTEATYYSYDAAGNLATQTSQQTGLCPCTTYGYNDANELTSISYPTGTPSVTSIGYDNDGQRTSMAVAGQTTESWGYDSLHRVTATVDGNDSTVSYGYDLDGNVTSITYPNGVGTVGRAYDAAGRLATVTDTVGAATHYTYDNDSNLLTQAYPNATQARVGYDNADRLQSITDTSTSAPSPPGFISFNYTRSAAGQITQTVTTGVVGAATTNFNYTAAQQLAQANDAANTFDQAENPLELQSGAVQTYNGGDELTSSGTISLVGAVTTTDPGSSSALTLGLPVTTTVNDQVIVSVVLQGSGTVTAPAGYSVVTSTATGSGSSDAETVVLAHTVAAGDGTTLTVTATASSLKVATALVYRGVSTAAIDAYSAGSATGSASVSTPSISTSVSGDHLVALLGANAGPSSWKSASSPSGLKAEASPSVGPVAAAAYDGVSLSTGGAGGLNATAASSGNLVGVLVALRPAITSYSYDSQGNQIGSSGSGVTTTMGYDAANRLVSYVSQTATSSATTTYRYFGDGSRAAKTTAAGTTSYTWDQVNATLLYNGTTAYIYGLGGAVLEQVNAAHVRLFYHQDQLGSTMALTDVTGTVVAAYTYDDNGNLTMATGTTTTPFGFAGQYRDAESGLIYMGARYYNPATAQFLTRDPAYAQTGSAYGYAGNDPIDNLDPTGLGGCLFFGHRAGPNSACAGASAIRKAALAAAIAAAIVATAVVVVGTGGAALAAVLPVEEVGIGLLTFDSLSTLAQVASLGNVLTLVSYGASTISTIATCGHSRDSNCLAAAASFIGGVAAGLLSATAQTAGSLGIAAAAALEGAAFAFAGLLNFDKSPVAGASSASSQGFGGPTALTPSGPSASIGSTPVCLT